jgi:hypothetical protein
VPEWGVLSLWLRGDRQVGMGLGNGAKWEPARVEKEASVGIDLSGTEGLSGIPSLRVRKRACAL